MTSTSKKAVLEVDTYCAQIIDLLEIEQDRKPSSILFGNYPSSRYHKVLPVRRTEDNVYFVSWINQLLHDIVSSGLLPEMLEGRTKDLIVNGEKAITSYRNRYGDLTYNFYRPKSWFPNGRLLSRFGIFQPTDDSDDTSIAFRGKNHTLDEAVAVKEIFKRQTNGKRNRWLKRTPKEYRRIGCYSTWIGSDQIYVDTDIVVLSNILIFNAKYGLDLCAEDKASLLFIKKAVLSRDYLKKKWSLSAWYPFDCVILYSLADLISLDYYEELKVIIDQVILDLSTITLTGQDPIQRLLVDSALMKIGHAPRFNDDLGAVDSWLKKSSSFSFGVIPLLHPLNGQFAQILSSFPFLRIYYDCKAQRLAILMENFLLRNSCEMNEEEKIKRRARTYKPDSVVLSE